MPLSRDRIRERYDRGVKRSTFELMVGGLAVLGAAVLILSIILMTSSTSDSTLRDTLVKAAVEQDGLARTAASQISRIGGSEAWQMIAQTRQHIYALQEVNELTMVLLGRSQPLVPEAALETAMRYLEDCERVLLQGNTIDTQLSLLWSQLDIVAEAVSAL